MMMLAIVCFSFQRLTCHAAAEDNVVLVATSDVHETVEKCADQDCDADKFDTGASLLARASYGVRQHTTDDDAVWVTFGGPGAKYIDRSENSVEQYGEYKLALRPNFVKSVRCKGLTEDTCEECDGRKDCFFTEAGTQGPRLDLFDETYTLHKAIIELSCGDEPATDARLTVQLEEGSTSEAYSVSVNGKPLTRPSADANWNYELKGKPPAVELQLVYTVPTNGLVLPHVNKEAASLKLKWAKPSFVHCEDHEMCLSTLWKPEATAPESAMHLREHNLLQYHCLDSGFADNLLWSELMLSWTGEALNQNNMKIACDQWTSCLTPVRAAALKTGLSASLFPDKPEASKDCKKPDPDGCIDPRVTDVEGWACNCMNEMTSRCNALEEACSTSLQCPQLTNVTCFAALYCSSKKVCPCWKKHFCKGKKMKQVKKLLKSDALGQAQAVLGQQNVWSHGPSDTVVSEVKAHMSPHSLLEQKRSDKRSIVGQEGSVDEALEAKGCV